MNNLSKDLKWLYDKVKELLTKPRVIDSGGSVGNWYYRKWSNGILECWIHKSYSDQRIDTAWGSLYYRDSGKMPNYPIAFTKYPCVTINTSFTRGNGWAVINESDYSLTNAGSIIYYSPVKITADNHINCSINIYARGTWK